MNDKHVNDSHPHCTEDPALKDNQNTISSLQPCDTYQDGRLILIDTNQLYQSVMSGFQQLKDNVGDVSILHKI